MKRTAIEVLKSSDLQDGTVDNPVELLHRVAEDKGWPIPVLRELAHSSAFGPLFGPLVLRDNRPETHTLLNYWGKQLGVARRTACPNVVKYLVKPSQTAQIDSAVKMREINTMIGFAGKSAGDNYAGVKEVLSGPQAKRLQKEKVLIIGAGPAGAIAARVLATIGFNVDVVDRRSEWGGIWTRPEVNRARNNPRNLSILGNYALKPGPGGGQEVLDFVKNLGSFISPIKKDVAKVSRRQRTLIVEEPESKLVAERKLLVNCAGLGGPAPLNDKMVTGTTKTGSGHRWQRNLSRADVERKMFCFVGLGNSTAEMLLQLQAFQAKGIDCDYRVLTHYPEDAVREPWSTYPAKNGLKYRVFRDLGAPELTAWAGDIDPIRACYMRALNAGKIKSGITRWDRSEAGTVSWRAGSNQSTEYLGVEDHNTLIGYRWPHEQYEKFNIAHSTVEGPRFDYDGELYDGSGRVPGYFGLGPVIESPTNKNATVIPGMIFRVSDLAFGMIVRSLEVSPE